MMDTSSRYFELTMESLRAIARWSADCAGRVLNLYEAHAGNDQRPRLAIEEIGRFADGGKRTALLRKLSMDAFSAARESDNPAAAAAARSAGFAAASAYTHPLADVHQTKHILGAAACALFSFELAWPDDPGSSALELLHALGTVTPAVRDVLLHMPDRQAGKGRLNILLFELDGLIRNLVFKDDPDYDDEPDTAETQYSPEKQEDMD